jgi:ABC-type polysaccharide/polyol phosphate export permease
MTYKLIVSLIKTFGGSTAGGKAGLIIFFVISKETSGSVSSVRGSYCISMTIVIRSVFVIIVVVVSCPVAIIIAMVIAVPVTAVIGVVVSPTPAVAKTVVVPAIIIIPGAVIVGGPPPVVSHIDAYSPTCR